MVARKNKAGNKWLVVILAVLVVVIVGLVVGIVSVRKTVTVGNEDNIDVEQLDAQEGVLGGEKLEKAQELYERGLELLKTNDNDSYMEAMTYFDTQTRMAASEDDKFEMATVRIDVLLEREYYSEALKYIDEINIDRLSEVQKGNVYFYYAVAYDGLGDKAKVNEYDSLLKESAKIVNKEDANVTQENS